jgi:hypothetical protein
VDLFDPLPTPFDVETDLKQIVHNFKRWEALPLRALRALPSVRSWEPPSAARDSYSKQPQRRSNAAIHQRIEEAITRTVLDEDRNALGSLFYFDELGLTLTKRQGKAAEYQGVKAESFRKETEKIMLRELSGEMYRWELEWALGQTQSPNGWDELDTGPPTVAQ